MMHESDYDQPSVTTAFRHERSVRRALSVLDIKHQRLQEDIEQFLHHLILLVPTAESTETTPMVLKTVLEDALKRLGDPAFAALILHTFAKQQGRQPPETPQQRVS